MKTKLLKIAPFALIVMVALVSLSMGFDFMTSSGISMAITPLVVIGKTEFVDKTSAEILAMTDLEALDYAKKRAERDNEVLETKMTAQIAEATKNNATKEEIETLKTMLATNKKANEDFVLEIKAAMERPVNVSAKNDVRKYIEENSEIFKALKADKHSANKHVNIVLKGTQGATDIGQRDDYATFLPGTVRQPIRRTSIMDLFKRKKVSTEYIKYREEDVVTRNAKFVIACATSTHTTKKTWVNRTVELAKIRDIVDVCLDMMDDYDFVESEIKELINDSVKLLADNELLLGSGVAATDMLSIDTISSEFDPNNVLAPFGDSFIDANIEQLVDAMAAQISVFGQENTWRADTVVMNFTDFVKFRNLKDTNGNKVILTMTDREATIAGLRVVTSPIVVANTLYVFDSTKGTILDRQMLTVKTSFENNDNIEHEMVTFVAVERLQFHVTTIDRDAFMKCSSISAALVTLDEATS